MIRLLQMFAALGARGAADNAGRALDQTRRVDARVDAVLARLAPMPTLDVGDAEARRAS